MRNPSEIVTSERGEIEWQVAVGVPGHTVFIAWETPDTYDGSQFTREDWERLKAIVDKAFEGN